MRVVLSEMHRFPGIPGGAGGFRSCGLGTPFVKGCFRRRRWQAGDGRKLPPERATRLEQWGWVTAPNGVVNWSDLRKCMSGPVWVVPPE